MRKNFGYIIILFCILLNGCTRTLTVGVSSSSYLNIDDNKHSLPVVLKIYQLADDQVFKQASFNALWQQPKPVLGVAYLSVHNVIVVPHSTKTISIPAVKGVKYVGFIAVFRNHGSANWRLVAPMSWHHDHYYLWLHGNTLKVDNS